MISLEFESLEFFLKEILIQSSCFKPSLISLSGVPLAPKDVQQVYQLNWGVFCALTRSDIVTICTFCLVQHVDLITYLLLARAGNQLQQTTIIIVKYALVEERIGGWYSILEARYVDRFGNKVFILYYNSVWLMFDHWRYISPTLPLSISKKEKLGKPKEEIGNLKWI